MSAWTVGWLLWLAWFLGLEGFALFNRQDGDTLSEHVWKWFRVQDPRPTGVTVALRGVLAVFLLWLAGHLVMGWWTPTDPHPWPW